MLGEGMPWHIILIFFVLGIWMGIRSASRDAARPSKKN